MRKINFPRESIKPKKSGYLSVKIQKKIVEKTHIDRNRPVILMKGAVFILPYPGKRLRKNLFSVTIKIKIVSAGGKNDRKK